MNLGLSENGDRPTIDVVIPAHIYIIQTYGNFNRDDDDDDYYYYY